MRLADLDDHALISQAEAIANADILLAQQGRRVVLSETANLEQVRAIRHLAVSGGIVGRAVLVQCLVDAAVHRVPLLVAHEACLGREHPAMAGALVDGRASGSCRFAG